MKISFMMKFEGVSINYTSQHLLEALKTVRPWLSHNLERKIKHGKGAHRQLNKKKDYCQVLPNI